MPPNVERKKFEEAYRLARKGIVEGKNIRENEFIRENFYMVVVDSFEKKLETGLDVVTYPQHYDMHGQFIEMVHVAMENGTYIVDEKMAVMPEVSVIGQEAARFYEKVGRKIALRVCVTGPIELYLKEVGTTVYTDVLLMFAETVRRFAKNAIIDSKHIKTEVVALDEPSFGFTDVNADRDTLIEVLEKALNFSGAVRQIHTHSPSRVPDLLQVENLDVVSIEYASYPQNIEHISRRMLEDADKQIRVGISRTDINNIIAELYEKGVTKPSTEHLVEDEETIMGRFKKAWERFGERLAFAGPDCGLGGWPTQEAAQFILKRTADAVKKCRVL